MSENNLLGSFINSTASKVLALLILLLALEYFPVTGIFLMLIAGPFIAGLLVHVFLICIFVEAVTGRLPRILAIIPIVAYCGYYAVFVRESWQLRQLSATLRMSNPSKVYNFDPNVSSLVMDRAQQFVQTHDIPAVYEVNSRFPEGYSSVRLITGGQCNGIQKDTLNRISISYFHFDGVFQKQLCLLTVPEQPPGGMVRVTSVHDKQPPTYLTGFRQQTTQISIDNSIAGSFKTATVQRLLAFPILGIGCFLNDGSSTWSCGAQFLRKTEAVDGTPETVDGAKFDDPVSVMLGIRKYTSADLKSFSESSNNAGALARAHEEPKRAEDEVFAALDGLINGQNPQIPFNFSYAITTNSDRLTPLADAMVRRFVTLVHSDILAVPNRNAQIAALGDAIGALPHAAFVDVAAPLLDLVKENPDRALSAYSIIYIRLGEAGADALPFYRIQLIAHLVKGVQEAFPVLALCRIGTADADLIQELKRRQRGREKPGRLQSIIVRHVVKAR